MKTEGTEDYFRKIICNKCVLIQPPPTRLSLRTMEWSWSWIGCWDNKSDAALYHCM